ncbi:hypothetical protein [Allofournierella sp.]|uniref:hypothetical protein n=1 Tax=Allofournierella sp. TaxID=1940256 RepID=UPI003AF0788D
MRILKRALKLGALILLSLLLLLVLLLELPFLAADGSTDGADHSGWMAATLSGPERLVDIAMPGAHDALTAGMHLSSPVDEASVASPFQLGICKGLGYRQSKAQIADLPALLAGGVRYFDIRVTRDASTGAFYTVHNYYSTPLADELAAFRGFLAAHPGEVLILDFQHCYDLTAPDARLGAAHFSELYALLEQSGLLEYAQAPALAGATYGQVTAGGSRAACLLLMKYTGGRAELLRYEASIHSPWFNTDDPAAVFSGLDAVAAQVAGGQVSRDVFRVQQAVLTMQASPSGLLNALGSWSLLRRAQSFNAQLADRQNGAWLAAMPIVMTDHSLSTRGSAHARLMASILEYDRQLAAAI